MAYGQSSFFSFFIWLPCFSFLTRNRYYRRVTQACLEHSHPTAAQTFDTDSTPSPPRYSGFGRSGPHQSAKRPRDESSLEWSHPWQGGQMIWRAIPSELLVHYHHPEDLSDHRPSSSSSMESARRGSLGDEWGANSADDEDDRPPKVMRQRAPSLADLVT